MKKGSARTARPKPQSKTKRVSRRQAKNVTKPSPTKRPHLPRHTPLLFKKKFEVPEASRFESITAPAPKEWESGGLPFSYNQTKLILLVRDPYWVYSYWDFSSETWDWTQSLKQKDPRCSAKLRIHNLDHGNFYDIDIGLEAKGWYVDVGLPDTTFEAELGIVDSKGQFYRIAKSNRIRTPRNRPAGVVDAQWCPEDFEWIYEWSGGGKIGSSELSSRTKKS